MATYFPTKKYKYVPKKQKNYWCRYKVREATNKVGQDTEEGKRVKITGTVRNSMEDGRHLVTQHSLSLPQSPVSAGSAGPLAISLFSTKELDTCKSV